MDDDGTKKNPMNRKSVFDEIEKSEFRMHLKLFGMVNLIEIRKNTEKN